MDPVLAKQEIHHLLKNNQLAKAREVCDKLCTFATDDAEAWFISAGVHAQLGAISEVAACCENAIKLQPDLVMAHYNLGLAYHSMGELTSAEKCFRSTLQLNPGKHNAVIALGLVVLKLGRSHESIDIYTCLLNGPAHNNPAIALQANINLGLALCEQKRFSEAEQACKNALSIDPASTEALNNLGQSLKGQGRLKEAANAHRKAINIRPDYVIAHSNLLLDLNYLADIDDRDVFAEHRQWGLSHAISSPLIPHPDGGHDPEKRLRVGYVSPDFRAHSVVLFTAGLLAKHDRSNVEIYCYSNVKRPDAWTSQIRESSDHWREINAMDDVQLAAMIKADGIDILVDLAGHTANNRLLAFAGKPAPVQVTWLGYPNTTGMSAIDYRLTDARADPPGASDELNTEILVRLPQGFLCYQPLRDSPPVNNLPMSRSGNVVFGCFNNCAKINDDVIVLWSKLLRELPDSRLLIKSNQLTDPPLRLRYFDTFERAGIDPQRIELQGHIASTIDHLALYHQVDVALDPFPYNGTTTTCEALWMGVPVVVLEGNTHAGRVGASLLGNVGLTELIAETKDDYVRICSELAKNPDRLSDLRATMRARLQNSPLLDIASFTRNIEAAYRNMWVAFCKQNQ